MCLFTMLELVLPLSRCARFLHALNQIFVCSLYSLWSFKLVDLQKSWPRSFLVYYILVFDVCLLGFVFSTYFISVFIFYLILLCFSFATYIFFPFLLIFLHFLWPRNNIQRTLSFLYFICGISL